jgi:phosphatidylglycerol lysyltransferase
MYQGRVDDDRIRRDIRRISEEWLSGRSELSFSMGGAHIDGYPEERLSVAFDSDGSVLGFVTWAPVYARRGWNLDFMRRRLDAPSGIMEYLITSSLLKFQEEGFEMASLGMAPLANISDGENDFPLLAKAISLVYEKMSSIYAYKSLQAFKAKFEPDWEDRYLVYSSNLAVPQVLYAVVKAHVQDVSLLSMVAGRFPSPQRIVKSLMEALAQQRGRVHPPSE